MSQPIFSVVMPVYNQAKYISQAIQSVLDQTIDSWELIIVDNHSTDGTVEVVQFFDDPRIKLSFIDNNGVIAKSRNQAIRSSTGNYIAFLDSDDFWFPTKLQEVSRVLKGKSELVYHWVEIVSEDGLEKFDF
jgi:teichuronic acid biosynthesis glycosyltransferase TuaG